MSYTPEEADELLPLRVLEPIVARGKTIRYRFFGLWRVSEAYTLDELIEVLDMDEELVVMQLRKLWMCG